MSRALLAAVKNVCSFSKGENCSTAKHPNAWQNVVNFPPPTHRVLDPQTRSKECISPAQSTESARPTRRVGTTTNVINEESEGGESNQWIVTGKISG